MKKFSTFFLFIFAFCVPLTFAEQLVTYNELEADYYETEGETAVLLLHGTLAHNRMEIISTIATLLVEDYDLPVLAPNLSLNLPSRQGMLDCDITHSHKHFDALSEIDIWVKYLKEVKGFTQIVISGHSRGGAQISAYLADKPDDIVKGAVVIAPSLYDAQYHRDNYRTRYKTDLTELIEVAESLDDDTVMEVPGFIFCQTAKVTASSFLSYYTPDSRRDTPSNLTRIKSVPVLVIAGSEDDVVAALPEKIKNNSEIGTNIRLETVEGADHFFRDLYADDVALLFSELIEEFQ